MFYSQHLNVKKSISACHIFECFRTSRLRPVPRVAGAGPEPGRGSYVEFLCGGVPLNQEGAPPSFVSSFQLDMTGAKQRLFPSTLN